MNCLDLAKLFLVQADQDGLSGTMTNMKINKLVYYAQCLNLALYGEPLFSEDMPSQAVLSLEDMRARGEEMLNEIEKADPSYHAEMNYAILQALADDQAPIVTVNEMNEWLDHVLAEAV